MIHTSDPRSARPRRADLHCHSDASSEASEALLNAISCPECFSKPEEVYAQARRRGMDFVTITDHDSIAGVETLAQRDDVFFGEELTCWFPEDRCKIHLLVWGLSAVDHAVLQARAGDIYAVAEYVEQARLAHAVAHPLYRQNDRLEREHLERLILLFRGFEVLNGAHSALHRSALEPMLDALDPAEIDRMARRYRLPPRWPQTWRKSRTAGSDDHGLLNIGRTWTEFPADIRGTEDLLECLRTGNCRPGGEAGSSLKLAHNLMSVSVRFHARRLVGERQDASPAVRLLQTAFGEAPQGGGLSGALRSLAGRAADLGRRALRAIGITANPPSGVALLGTLLAQSALDRFPAQPELRAAVAAGEPPVSEHSASFRLLSQVSQDALSGLAQHVERRVRAGELDAVFDGIAALAAHQFLHLPYYFALFHQNRERGVLERLVGRAAPRNPERLRVGIFTDALDGPTGIGRTVGDLAREAARLGRHVDVLTCTREPRVVAPWRTNFLPMLQRDLPLRTEVRLVLPPIPEILEWVDRRQFDSIQVETAGPMGLVGLLAARMLRVPVVAVCHRDVESWVSTWTGDQRMSSVARSFAAWFYAQAAGVVARSRGFHSHLRELGIPEVRLAVVPPCVDPLRFRPDARDPWLWLRLGIPQPHRLLYCGRLGPDKNLELLADTFRRVCARRHDTALVLAGDGPCRRQLERSISGLPVRFLGEVDDELLPRLYAGADLLLFPSHADALGQSVLEAQASGLPVVAAAGGGSCEWLDDGVTGRVLPAHDPALWADVIGTLLDDAGMRERMARTGPQRVARFTPAKSLESLWEAHRSRAVDARGAAGRTTHEDAMPAAAGR